MSIRWIVLVIITSMAMLGCGFGTIFSILEKSYVAATWWFVGAVLYLIATIIIVVVRMFPQQKDEVK